jgi:hypothetical protein
MRGVIERLPPPVVADILRNRSLPIIGAGFSKNAVLPPGRVMPGWDELGRILSEAVANYEYDGNPIDAISAYAHEFGRVRLVDELREKLHTTEARVGSAHEAFCRLPFDIVCTTKRLVT